MCGAMCCAEHLRRQTEALLSRHEVDLVLSGHVHSYARTCNVLAGSCVDMRDGGWGPFDSRSHQQWQLLAAPSFLLNHWALLPDMVGPVHACAVWRCKM